MIIIIFHNETWIFLFQFILYKMGSIDVGVGTLPYLLFQFMPIILFGVFLLMSLLHQDIRASIYSAGLLLAMTIAVLIQKWSIFTGIHLNNNLFLLSPNIELSPALSLNLVMYAFTFTYLLTGMIQYKTVDENIPTIVFLTILLFAEIVWRGVYLKDDAKSVTIPKIIGLSLLSITIGFVVGLTWAGVIIGGNNKKMMYLIGLNTRETCTATKQKMVCKLKTTR